jgi:hypothetical protein
MKLTEAQLREIWREQTARATPRQVEILDPKDQLR